MTFNEANKKKNGILICFINALDLKRLSLPLVLVLYYVPSVMCTVCAVCTKMNPQKVFH